jgi:ribulose-bisphosphate carboxylase large chain
MIPLEKDNPLRKFFAAEYELNPDDTITLTYYFETDHDPYESAAHLCQEQSTAQYKRVDVDEDFRPKHAAKVLKVYKVEDTAPFYDEADPEGVSRAKDGWLVDIAYPHVNFGPRIPNMLTAICGEGAFHSPHMTTIKLMDINFPDCYLEDFEGPQYGLAGIREQLQVFDRPLTLGVIKPNIGLDPQPFGKLAYGAWLQGLDIAKDDELLCDTPWSPFERRTKILGGLRLKAEKETGMPKVYLANITDEVDRMFELYDLGRENHVNSMMINGMTTGLSIVRALAKKGRVPLYSHFDFIAPFTQDRYFGVSLKATIKLHRLAGYDAMIYQGLGDRMRTTVQDVLDGFDACLAPMGHLRPILPVPAGSQWAGSLGKLYHLFGENKDFAIVPGRAVFSHPMGPGAGAKALLQGWEAAINDIPLEDYAKTHPELAAAIAARG